jgi:uncharacterized protein YndB with AHSA1/START domain
MASKITVEVIVNASLQKTWDSWTSPTHIVNWNNASDDWHTTLATNDLRTGGSFMSRMAAKDGSFSFDFNGVYDQVITHKRIVYSIEDGRKVTIDFSEEGYSTKIVEIFEAETENSEELQRAGWQAILYNFKKYTENNL